MVGAGRGVGALRTPRGRKLDEGWGLLAVRHADAAWSQTH